MIKWCAYCQQFMTEVEPFDDYRMTHGICSTCQPRLEDFGPAAKDALAGVIDFY